MAFILALFTLGFFIPQAQAFHVNACVWIDANCDGIRQDTEVSASGVTVEVYYSDGTLAYLRALVAGGNQYEPARKVIGTDGCVRFDIRRRDFGTDPFDIYLKFILPDGKTFTSKDVGGDDTKDSDVNPTTGITDTFTINLNDDPTLQAGLCEATPTNPGTGTIGYWKNHPEAWPVGSLTLGGVSYTKAALLVILNTAGSGDKSLDLAKQLIAAKLNVLIGNADSCIASTITAADAWLAQYGVGTNIRANSPAWAIGGPLHTTLNDYNNGLLCAPHRD